MQSEKIDLLASALLKAQSEILGAKKDSENPFFKSQYADLETVWETIRGPLSKNGLSIAQPLEADEHGSYLVTTLLHTSGQFISGRVKLIASKQDPQGYGAAITYFRRFSLASMVGVYQVDDDGNEASGRTGPATKQVIKRKPGPASEDF